MSQIFEPVRLTGKNLISKNLLCHRFGLRWPDLDEPPKVHLLDVLEESLEVAELRGTRKVGMLGYEGGGRVPEWE